MSNPTEPVYNAAGTHVFTTSPTGDEWECPPDYLPVALQRGFALSEPRDKSLDGLFDDSTAEGANQTGFDPGKASVKAVNDHLASHLASEGEIERVLALEVAGQNRPSVKDPREADEPNPGD